WAAKNGHIEIVKLLLSHPEIDVNQANNIGFTPLYWAAKKSRVDIINALLSDPKINMNEDVREYLDRLVANNDVDTIQEIVLNGCSKEVYEYLHTKAIEAGKEHLIERLSHLFTGYANMEALGGHYKAYNAEVDVPEDLLNIVKEYLNPNLPKQTNVSDTQKRTCIRKSLQTYISASIYKLFGL
ncbi:MAG: ankyrin repeat domain-containing protein, partial [Desulfobacteraceae bacterium]|nr:ankyrin repeat domain-containing protein [Desulfobacteraceae bacterium]